MDNDRYPLRYTFGLFYAVYGLLFLYFIIS